MLDAMTGSVAIAENARLDALATNHLARAFYSDLFGGPGRPVNFARYIFLDPRSQDFYADWERAARESVALLRSEAGRNPYDRGLSDLVGELSTQSEQFRGHWAAHNVRLHNKGVKRFNHPTVALGACSESDNMRRFRCTVVSPTVSWGTTAVTGRSRLSVRTAIMGGGPRGVRLSGGYEPGFVGEHDRLDPIPQMEFHQDACDVSLDGPAADDEPLCDLAVRQSARD